MIQRREYLKRAPTPIPQRRAKPRRGPARDRSYMDWLHDRKCVACGMDDPRQRCDAAHTKNNGMRSKGPDSSCVPLCRAHHMEYDVGRKAFEDLHRLVMEWEAAAHYDLYLDCMGRKK